MFILAIFNGNASGKRQVPGLHLKSARISQLSKSPTKAPFAAVNIY